MDSVLLATGSSGAGGNSAAGASAGVGGVGGGGSGGGGGGGLGRRGRGGGGGGGGAGGAVGGGVGSGISGPQGISLIGPSVGGGIGSTGGGPGQFVLVDRSPNNSSIATTSTHSTNTSISSTATGATLVDSDRDREWARLRAQQTAKASRSTLRSGAGGSTEQLRSGSAPGIYNSGGSTFTNTPSHQTNVPNPPKYLTNSISFTSEGSMAVPTKPPVIPGALVAVAAASGSGVLMPRSSSIKRADEHDTSISQYHQQLFRHQQLQMYKQALYQQPSIAAANQRQQLQQPIHQHKQHQHQHVNSSIVSHQAPNNPSPPATDSDLAPTWLSNGGTSVPASQPLVGGSAVSGATVHRRTSSRSNTGWYSHRPAQGPSPTPTPLPSPLPTGLPAGAATTSTFSEPAFVEPEVRRTNAFYNHVSSYAPSGPLASPPDPTHTIRQFSSSFSPRLYQPFVSPMYQPSGLSNSYREGAPAGIPAPRSVGTDEMVDFTRLSPNFLSGRFSPAQFSPHPAAVIPDSPQNSFAHTSFNGAAPSIHIPTTPGTASLSRSLSRLYTPSSTLSRDMSIRSRLSNRSRLSRFNLPSTFSLISLYSDVADSVGEVLSVTEDDAEYGAEEILAETPSSQKRYSSFEALSSLPKTPPPSSPHRRSTASDAAQRSEKPRRPISSTESVSKLNRNHAVRLAYKNRKARLAIAARRAHMLRENIKVLSNLLHEMYTEYQEKVVVGEAAALVQVTGTLDRSSTRASSSLSGGASLTARRASGRSSINRFVASEASRRVSRPESANSLSTENSAASVVIAGIEDDESGESVSVLTTGGATQRTNRQRGDSTATNASSVLFDSFANFQGFEGDDEEDEGGRSGSDSDSDSENSLEVDYLSRLFPHWTVGPLIGTGATGTVFAAVDPDPPHKPLFAIKRTRVSNVHPWLPLPKLFATIVKSLRLADHPNVLIYHGVERIGDDMYVFMEFASDRSVRDYIYESNDTKPAQEPAGPGLNNPPTTSGRTTPPSIASSVTTLKPGGQFSDSLPTSLANTIVTGSDSQTVLASNERTSNSANSLSSPSLPPTSTPGIRDRNIIRLWMKMLVEGVRFLHDMGVIHRDLKPGNLLVKDGQIKICDFGASTIRQSCCTTPHMTQMMGSPCYMSPELITGPKSSPFPFGAPPNHPSAAAPTHDIGAQDIWSIGCCLYEMVLGHPPWHQVDNMFALYYLIGTWSVRNAAAASGSGDKNGCARHGSGSGMTDLWKRPRGGGIWSTVEEEKVERVGGGSLQSRRKRKPGPPKKEKGEAPAGESLKENEAEADTSALASTNVLKLPPFVPARGSSRGGNEIVLKEGTSFAMAMAAVAASVARKMSATDLAVNQNPVIPESTEDIESENSPPEDEVVSPAAIVSPVAGAVPVVGGSGGQKLPAVGATVSSIASPVSRLSTAFSSSENSSSGSRRRSFIGPRLSLLDGNARVSWSSGRASIGSMNSGTANPAFNQEFDVLQRVLSPGGSDSGSSGLITPTRLPTSLPRTLGNVSRPRTSSAPIQSSPLTGAFPSPAIYSSGTAFPYPIPSTPVSSTNPVTSVPAVDLSATTSSLDSQKRISAPTSQPLPPSAALYMYRPLPAAPSPPSRSTPSPLPPPVAEEATIPASLTSTMSSLGEMKDTGVNPTRTSSLKTSQARALPTAAVPTLKPVVEEISQSEQSPTTLAPAQNLAPPSDGGDASASLRPDSSSPPPLQTLTFAHRGHRSSVPATPRTAARNKLVSTQLLPRTSSVAASLSLATGDLGILDIRSPTLSLSGMSLSGVSSGGGSAAAAATSASDAAAARANGLHSPNELAAAAAIVLAGVPARLVTAALPKSSADDAHQHRAAVADSAASAASGDDRRPTDGDGGSTERSRQREEVLATAGTAECLLGHEDCAMWTRAMHNPLMMAALESGKFSYLALDFLNLCLQWDPRRRATATELLQHPFLAQVVWDYREHYSEGPVS